MESTMERLLLIRHGETAWNAGKIFRGRSDIPLSERGMEQARLTAAALRDTPIEAIYSSPLQRSLQTAKAIAAPHAKEVIVVEGLNDLDCGEWSGKSLEQVAADYADLYRLWETEPQKVKMPGGETLADVVERAAAAVKDIAAETGGTAVVVSHRVTLKLLVLHLMGLGPDSFWKVRLDTCSITTFDCRQDRFVLCGLNDTNHLSGSAEAGRFDF